MKLATEIRWQDSDFRIPVSRIQATERWGYDAVFAAEAFGGDAFTPLGFLAAVTERLKLGTCIAPVSARTPAVTAMTYQTLHAMSGGRVIAGVGSGTEYFTEAFHGRPWDSPLDRMRDFLILLRQGINGEPLQHDGRVISQPRHDLPATSTFLYPTPEIPVMVGASGPKMITMAAELADGWFPAGFAPGVMESVRPLLEAGFARAGGTKSWQDFDIWVHVDCICDDDVAAAMRPFKEYVVTWVDMQRSLMASRGYPGLADRLTELRDAGFFEDAVAAVPDEYIDDGWLVGPVSRIARRVEPWLDCGATGLIIRYGPQGMNQRIEEPLEVFEAIGHAVHR